MTVIPGLTTTDKGALPRFVEDLRRSAARSIALFPTTLPGPERRQLYRELESIPGLVIPHVHLRTDCDEQEMEYLADRFATEVFNVHPRAGRHPFGAIPPRFAARIFLENSDVAISDVELPGLGGMCPDYSHLESARLCGRSAYAATTESQLARFPIGCCHVSAIRIGDPNTWSGGWDHHRLRQLSDLDYMARYRDRLPERWVSLELENPLSEQLEAAAYLQRLLDGIHAGLAGAVP